MTIFSLSLSLQACKKEPAKIISISPSDFSTQDQIKIGDAFRNTIEQSPGQFNILDRAVYKDAYIYIEKLFSTMLNTAQVERRLVYNWSVHIINDDSKTTLFFLPGGHLYIYTGLLKYVDTESQLLEIIGHEIYYTDTDLLILKMKDEFDGKTLGDILLGNNVPQMGALAADMPMLTFEEKDVMLADSFAVAMICPFLYEPLGIKSLVGKADSESVNLDWLMTRAANLDSRNSNLERQALPCGLNGVTNEEAYQNFKTEYLPK